MQPEWHQYRYLRAAEDMRVVERSREIQFILNLIEPDPALQPFFLSDKSRPSDIFEREEEFHKLQLAINSYFGRSIPITPDLTFWELVDQIWSRIPDWPPADPWMDDR